MVKKSKNFMEACADMLDNRILKEDIEDKVTPGQTSEEDAPEAMEDEQTAGTETGFASVETENPLEEKVKEMIIDNADGDYETWLKDLSQHGCVSGMCSGLIYYNETGKFHDEFENEIWKLVDEAKDSMGSKNILEFIGGLNGAENVGSMDQLKNLLAWFAFEEVARTLAERG
jgi:hypothetical protein